MSNKDFLNKLGEMHTAERELTAALPLLIGAAKSPDLETLLRVHLQETHGHVALLDGIAEHLGRKLPRRRCRPITKLIGEAAKVIGKRVVSSDQDAALIAVGRKIERFEINAYQELRDAAARSGLLHEVAILSSILSQEEMADELLAELAAGKGPIKDLVERASLKRAWGEARMPPHAA